MLILIHLKIIAGSTEVIYTSPSTIQTRITSKIVSEIIPETTTIKPDQNIYKNLTTISKIISSTNKSQKHPVEIKKVSLNTSHKI